MSVVLTADRLYCERDERVLFQALSFQLNRGDILHLKGPNGAGKTTLLRRLVGLGHVVEGSVEWFPGAEKAGAEPNEKIWYIAHRPAVTLLQSPLENLRYGLALHGHQVPGEQLWQALVQVGLKGFEDVPSHQLSAGQQRRVALARLFLTVPGVEAWVLDEPLTALDVQAVDLLKARIQEFAAGGGSVIMTSHHGIEGSQVRSLVLNGQSREEQMQGGQA